MVPAAAKKIGREISIDFRCLRAAVERIIVTACEAGTKAIGGQEVTV